MLAASHSGLEKSIMGFRFFHTADVHLGSPLVGLRAQDPELGQHFIGATRSAFANLVTSAIEEEVAFVLIAGDLFDGDWKDYATGQFFVREVGKLTRAGIRVVLLKGNHDAASVVSKSLPLPDGVTVLSHRKPETCLLKEYGVAVHGQSFPHRAVPENLSLSYPHPQAGLFNIGLLHTSLAGYSEHETYAPCTADDLQRRGYDYWALGHVHTREVIGDTPTIVFPGNLQGRHVHESGAKGATLVTVDAGRITDLTPVALDAARWAAPSIDLSGTERQQDVVSRVREAIEREADAAEGRPLAVRVFLSGETVLNGELRAARSRLTEELQAVAAHVSENILVEKVELKTSERRLQATAALLATGDLTTALDAVIASESFQSSLTTDLREIIDKLPAEAAGNASTGASMQQRPEILAAARGLIMGLIHGPAGEPPQGSAS